MTIDKHNINNIEADKTHAITPRNCILNNKIFILINYLIFAVI